MRAVDRRYMTSMSELAYTVVIGVPRAHRDDWLGWMRGGHLQDVIDGGALRAELIELDGGATFEARFLFASREAFERYERDHAPRLRAEGLARFGVEQGFVYTRTVGVVVS